MMSASQFANLLHARRVGRGKWAANCPCHEGDGRRHKPSLSIADGRKGLVFKCMSAGCDSKDILAAMGLSWGDILGEHDITPQMRGRWKDEARLALLERKAVLFLLLYAVEGLKYWDVADRRTQGQIVELRDRLYPNEAALRKAREHVHATIEKYGWDAVWWRWMQTERGKAVVEQYGIGGTYEPRA